MWHFLFPLILLVASLRITPVSATPEGTLLPGFERGRWFREQVCEEHTQDGIRLLWNAPEKIDPSLPTRLVLFATPNGNTAEQTLGAKTVLGGDWHFDIQHIAAQTRLWRTQEHGENIVLLVVQPDERSWPAWRENQKGKDRQRIRELVKSARTRLGSATGVFLTGHSGGGSFLFAFVESQNAIPVWVERIAFLDANYNFDGATHGAKFQTWLNASPKHRLYVLAYDDRAITLNNKPVVGPTGGTFRATQRMLDYFAAQKVTLQTDSSGDFDTAVGWTGRFRALRHRNPENKILHTMLVERNGYLWAVTRDTGLSEMPDMPFGPRLYDDWVQPSEEIPLRASTPNIPTGTAFLETLKSLPLPEQETAIEREITSGNLPPFLHQWQHVVIEEKDMAGILHRVECEVMPDYLAVGGDTDFVRLPMTPQTARKIADAFGCTLPTRKLVDAIYAAAAVKIAPQPLTEEREAIRTFGQHNTLIEKARAGKPLGLLVAGIKKDIVQTPRLAEKPGRVAIYGWHKLDSTPIQPLTTIHRDTYRDYSHGVRLVRRRVLVDGQPRSFEALLADPHLCYLVSDEGSF